jgi:flagellin
MAMSITTNVSSLMAQENLRVNSDFQSRTIQRLTSGYRINSSGDDAAGLAVANKFRSDTSELSQGVRNANDGLSTLQIVDGGLNDISQMLDRLKTLATQSASATFTGDRTTLNNEFGALLSEIDRQAANIGLGTGSYGGRYNTDISVYVGGGGTTQSNSKVTISLSGSSNRVDSSGLGLSGASVAAGGATKLSVSNDLSTGTTFLSGSTAQAFTVSIAKSGQPAFDLTVTITGDADGLSGADIVSQFNNSLSTYGISASLASDGKLQFSGGTAFSIRAAGATGTNQIITGAGNMTNTSMYTGAGAASFVALASDTETIKLTVGTQSITTVLDVNNGGTMQAALNTLNNNLNGMGIYAVKNAAGTGIDFQSAADFTFQATNSNGTPAEGVFVAAVGATSATDPTAGSGVTSAAEAAITKITAAVSTLGLVQGKVGTAQNKLQYSINLAQSQIASFSAAESRIRDTDVAAEAANLTKAQVMQQASLAAMAQANSAPQAVLALLRG